MSLVRNSVQVFITRLLRLAISLGTGMLLARWLQPEGRGAYTLVTVFHLFLVALGGMSIGYAVIHFSGGKQETTEQQVSNALFSAILLSLFLCPAVVILRTNINRFVPFTPNILLIIIPLIPISILDSYWRAVLQTQYKFLWLNSLEIVQAGIFGIGMILCYYLAAPRLETALYVWAASLVISFSLLAYLIGRVSRIVLTANWMTFKKYFLFGIKAHLSTVVGLLSLRLDTYILNFSAGHAAVGQYAVAVSLAEMLWFLPTSVAYVLLPTAAHRDQHDSAVLIRRTCLWVIILSGVGGVLLAAAAPMIIRYGFGQSYLSSLSALWLLLPGMVAVSVTVITTPFFLGKLGKPHLGALVAGVSLASNIVLNVMLIPKWGINGAAIASTGSYLLATGINLYLFNKTAKHNEKKSG
jgi:O-antigen/teichoic acid export membrane protein